MIVRSIKLQLDYPVGLFPCEIKSQMETLQCLLEHALRDVERYHHESDSLSQERSGLNAELFELRTTVHGLTTLVTRYRKDQDSLDATIASSESKYETLKENYSRKVSDLHKWIDRFFLQEKIFEEKFREKETDFQNLRHDVIILDAKGTLAEARYNKLGELLPDVFAYIKHIDELHAERYERKIRFESERGHEDPGLAAVLSCDIPLSIAKRGDEMPSDKRVIFYKTLIDWMPLNVTTAELFGMARIYKAKSGHSSRVR